MSQLYTADVCVVMQQFVTKVCSMWESEMLAAVAIILIHTMRWLFVQCQLHVFDVWSWVKKAQLNIRVEHKNRAFSEAKSADFLSNEQFPLGSKMWQLHTMIGAHAIRIFCTSMIVIVLFLPSVTFAALKTSHTIPHKTFEILPDLLRVVGFEWFVFALVSHLVCTLSWKFSTCCIWIHICVCFSKRRGIPDLNAQQMHNSNLYSTKSYMTTTCKLHLTTNPEWTNVMSPRTPNSLHSFPDHRKSKTSVRVPSHSFWLKIAFVHSILNRAWPKCDFRSKPERSKTKKLWTPYPITWTLNL